MTVLVFHQFKYSQKYIIFYDFKHKNKVVSPESRISLCQMKNE